MNRIYFTCLLGVALATCLLQRHSPCDEPQRDGPWITESKPQGPLTQTAEMILHPKAETQPALKYRLIPDAFELSEGNSAIYYLKAMGFLEQSSAASRLQEFYENSRKKANETGVQIDTLPPYVWQGMAPKELPIAEVKEYLSYTSFQPDLISEATTRAEFSLDRNIRSVDNPIGYMLPEIQKMRELARTQSLRCRMAIAEHKIDLAISILQQQITLAKRLGDDEFIVCNLVGVAILGIATEDSIYLLQQADAPNLYWAFASLPKPLISSEKGLSTERQFFNLQLKALRDVDETLRPSGYWQDFIDRVLPQLRGLAIEGLSLGPDDPQLSRAAFVSFIAAAYPGAKRYLLEELKLDRAQVDAYPTAQVVFLAAKRYHERAADDLFKWLSIPYEQLENVPAFKQVEQKLGAGSNRVGWASSATDLLLPSVNAFRSAQTRVQQQIALLQTVEAIRMYAAANDAKLPSSLSDLPYPAPNDPFTGKPFQYSIEGGQALLVGQPTPFNQYRFKLSIAK